MTRRQKIIASAACACLIGLTGTGLAASDCQTYSRACGTYSQCDRTGTRARYTVCGSSTSGWVISGCGSYGGTTRPGCTGSGSSCTGGSATSCPTRPTSTATASPTSTAAPTSTAKPTAPATARPTATATASPTSRPTNDGVASSSMAQQVLDIVNSERTAGGLNALTMDSGLSAAAQVRAEEITRSFSHTRPDGSSFSTVTSGAYGENIAKGQSSAARVMAAWMSSSGHRANIMNSRYTKIGVCAYEYNGVMYWVQLFGR